MSLQKLQKLHMGQNPDTTIFDVTKFPIILMKRIERTNPKIFPDITILSVQSQYNISKNYSMIYTREFTVKL